MIETYFPSVYFDINFWNKKQLSFRFQKMNRKCTACTVISEQQPEIMQHGAMFYFSATYEKKADDLQQNYLRINYVWWGAPEQIAAWNVPFTTLNYSPRWLISQWRLYKGSVIYLG